ncbi:uncharacterized protein LOC129903633 [Solanum dulcamara]|uniref:uncharacterized protein LOC129903633 n=1 Tax=Solanum dulcamara TaxID=45834 RepID=UPI0024853ED6|nr:uncharacterized protein LOC129903633 [Solanum dulcamara]
MRDTNVSSFEENTMPSSSRTPVSTAMATVEKPRKFTGISFKCLQYKMFFYLTTLSLQRIINEDVHVVEEETPKNEKFIVTEAWTYSDFLCNNYILNGLEDGLYNVFSVCKTSKELWYAQEKKYKTEDAGLKKFVATKFLDYKMVDSKTVMYDHKWNISSSGVIEKLPPSWKDFKNYLKHKQRKMTLEDLIVRLRIEEDNKVAEKKARGNLIIMGANIIKDGPNKSKKRKIPSVPKNYPSKKKFKGDCHNCEKTGHKVVECRAPKKEKKKGQTSMIDTNGDVNLCTILTECNLVENSKE